jgi:hypothetical protein
MKNDNCKDDKKSINWTSLQACDQMFSNPLFEYFLLTVMYLFSTQTSLAMRVKKRIDLSVVTGNFVKLLFGNKDLHPIRVMLPPLTHDG